jgi:N-acetylmuramic acid 6-phosphate etherase
MNTEDISPRYLDFDLWSNIEALTALYEGQLAAVAAIGPALPAIAAAVDDAAPRLRRGGRLVYVGAGTSGRIGVQDGAELTPTFNWPRDRLVFAMAGGEAALLRAVEGAEDSRENGAARMEEIAVGANDVVLGLTASGETPYTVSAIETARRRGAMTVGIANNPGAPLLLASAHPILIQTGEEIIAGSTRLKAGTAQKIALNLFSTLTMVRLGKVYRGLMVHMLPVNEKLRRRSVRIVSAISGCDESAAAFALAKSEGDVKGAALIVKGMEPDAVQALLDKHEGNLRAALAEWSAGAAAAP